jgi:hypothetical protein
VAYEAKVRLSLSLSIDLETVAQLLGNAYIFTFSLVYLVL